MEQLTVLPLSIQNIVQCDQVFGLVHGTRSHSSQLLHVCSYAEQQTHVYTQSSDVRASLAADPEDTEVAVVVELNQLRFVDGSDTELTLDGGDQGRSLEEGAGEELEDASKLGLAAGNLVVEPHNRNVLLSGSLLRLDKSGGSVDAHDQASCDFGVEGTAVAGLFYAQHALHPSNDLVGGGVRWFVQLRKGIVSGAQTFFAARNRSHVDDTGRDCRLLAIFARQDREKAGA